MIAFLVTEEVFLFNGHLSEKKVVINGQPVKSIKCMGTRVFFFAAVGNDYTGKRESFL